MKSKIEQYKAELADLMETKNDPNTPKDIKNAIEPAIEKVKKMIKDEESKPSETKAKPAEKKAAEKKPAKAEKKSAPAKKSGSALERCKEIIAKYRDKKKADVKRVEKRRKAGKPAELTPAETINKAAKSVKAKVVEMDKSLKVSEETSIINGIISSAVSAMAGIKDVHRKKMFIGKIIEGLRKLEKNLNMKRAEDGMYLHEIDENFKDDNAEMLRLNVVEIEHHVSEILNALKSGVEVEGWVLSRSVRAKTDMSDITHYLDSTLKADSMADGGEVQKVNMGNGVFLDLEDAIKMYEDKINSQGRIVNERDEDMLKQLKRMRNNYAMGGMMAKGGDIEYKASDYEYIGIPSRMRYEFKNKKDGTILTLQSYWNNRVGDTWEMTPEEALNKHFEDIEKDIKRNERMLKNINPKYWEKVRSSKVFNTPNEAEKKVIDYMYRLGYSAKNYNIEKRGEGYVITFDSYVENADGGYMAKGGEMDDKISKVVMAIRKSKIHPDDVSPNFVNEIANEIGINLSSKEVVDISDNYGEKYASGGMMAKGGELDIKKFREQYDENEDDNAHSENVVLLAEYFGTKQDVKDAKNILAKHEAIGSMPSDLMKKRDALHDKLWDIYKEKMGMGGEMAKRGRLLSAINRDRAYKSNQEWEKDYKRKARPKNPKYNTSYAMGGQAPVKKYPSLANNTTDLIN